MTELLVLCTGNAARSVMAGFMFEQLKLSHPGGEQLHVVTAGTHTIDGQPMGMRTRNAMKTIPELADAEFNKHRSRQVYAPDFALAELVVVMEADHVRTAMFRPLCRDLAPGPEPLSDRVRALRLGEVELSDAEDVTDPAGRDADTYAACVAELWGLCQSLITLL
jgi:protein-tyrosine-phosphatase